MSNPVQQSRARRGCLPGCLLNVVLLFIAGILVVMAVQALTAPWIYVVGGRIRPFPVWSGMGDIQGPSGRYRLYLWFSPKSGGSRILPSTNVLGAGYVCTPKGERFSLRVTGGASGNIWRNMDGHDFHLSAYHRPLFWSFSDAKTWLPKLSLRGRWVGPNLVMSDEGSFAHAFLPDGSLNTIPPNWYPKVNGVPITLTETGWTWGYRCPQPGR